MMRFVLILSLVLLSSGCSTIMHELQPHRMWRLNYQEPSGRTDGVYFSIDDPLPVAERSAAASEDQKTQG